MNTKAAVTLALSSARSEAGDGGQVEIRSDGKEHWVVASERSNRGKPQLVPFTTSISIGTKAPPKSVSVNVSTVQGLPCGTSVFLSPRVDLPGNAKT
eukprot:4299995-Pyramimonas_sp.AAC.1